MQLYINNWAAQLTAQALPSTEQLFVAPGQAAQLLGLGGDNYYLLTLVELNGQGAEIDWEVVTVIVADETTGELTLLEGGRGQEGTAARLWSIGTPISARVTAATLAELRDNAGAQVSDAEPQALGASAAGADPAASRADHVHPAPTPADIGAATAAQGAKADSALQENDVALVALTGHYDDLTARPYIPEVPGDIGAATAAQGDLADSAVQPAALTAGLADKVDKVAGKGLTPEEFTTAEKSKLAALDDNHWKGTFANLAALEAAHPTASPGNYADVDAGAGDPVLRYIWDASDSEWVAQAGSADPITAAQAKTLYESNADTNAYTDSEKTKLSGVAANATANPNTDSLPESGTPTNKWFTEARVRDLVLSWLSFADNSAVLISDTLGQAVGKLAARLALVGMPAGGTTGQVLKKTSGSDFAAAWATESGSSGGREVLTAARTYYVRTDGSDSNNGLTDSAGGAFLTIQKAVDVANGMLDAQTFQVTVQVRDGTYTTPLIVRAMLGTKPLIIRGNSSTPSNVHVNVTGSAFLTELPSAFVQLFDMKITATTVAIFANPAGIIEYGNIVFGSAGLRHVSAQTRGYVTPIGSYTIEGGAQQHVFSNNGGAIRLGAPSSTITITLSGTPNFTDAFAKAVAANLYVSGSPPTFSGAATGKRYDTSLNGVINTFGAGDLFFPGNVDGTKSTGGEYA